MNTFFSRKDTITSFVSHNLKLQYDITDLLQKLIMRVLYQYESGGGEKVLVCVPAVKPVKPQAPNLSNLRHHYKPGVKKAISRANCSWQPHKANGSKSAGAAVMSCAHFAPCDPPSSHTRPSVHVKAPLPVPAALTGRADTKCNHPNWLRGEK